MTTVLVTGYEPFGGYPLNPSAIVALDVDGTRSGGAFVVGREIPVSLRAMPARLAELLDAVAPDVVIGLGLSAATPCIDVERVAINLADLATTPDNDGYAASDLPLVSGGPAALFATIPTRPIVEALVGAGIPARLSYAAGTHLCNAALYHTLLVARDRGLPIRAGFLHLPCLPELAALQKPVAPSMSLDLMRRAVEIAVACAAADMSDGPLHMNAGQASSSR